MRRFLLIAPVIAAALAVGAQQPDVTEPITFLLVPIAGPVVPRSGAVLIEAAAGDDVDLIDVGFYVNGKLECLDTRAPYECEWKKKRHPGREYSVELRAEDTSGNVGVSEAFVFRTEE